MNGWLLSVCIKSHVQHFVTCYSLLHTRSIIWLVMLNKLMKFWTSMKLVSSGSVAIVCNSFLANSPEMSNYRSNQTQQRHLKVFIKTRKNSNSKQNDQIKSINIPLTSTPRVISVISSGIMAAASVLVASLSVDWPSLITIPIFLVLCLSPLAAEDNQYFA